MSRTTAIGPSRHFAPPHDFGRNRGIAEVGEQPSIAEGDARDPKQTSDPQFAMSVDDPEAEVAIGLRLVASSLCCVHLPSSRDLAGGLDAGPSAI